MGVSIRWDSIVGELSAIAFETLESVWCLKLRTFNRKMMMKTIISFVGVMFALLASCHDSKPVGSDDSDSTSDPDTVNTTDPETETLEQAPFDFVEGFDWILLQGGTFQMGEDCSEMATDCATEPVHGVTLNDFELLKTEVTMDQYRTCYESGVCPSPNVEDNRCDNFFVQGENLFLPEYSEHPIVCVAWTAARLFCNWIGADLPSETEWEYAASSRGETNSYPWGETTASCDLAVMSPGGDLPTGGCGEGFAAVVCSNLSGMSQQGICDLAGNVSEWTLDYYHPNYIGSPEDNGAWFEPEDIHGHRILRGGNWWSNSAELLSFGRSFENEDVENLEIGFRCAREY